MTSPAPKPTLIVSGGPVMQSLLAPLSQHYALVIIYQQAADVCAKLGLPDVAPLGAFLDGPTTDRIKTTAARMGGRVAESMPAIAARFSEAYGGQAPHSLNGYLSEWWPGYAHDRLLSTVGVAANTERVLQSRNVAGLLVHEDVTSEMRAAVAMARKYGAKTLHLPHNPCHLLPGVPDIHREVRAEYVLASGDYMAEFYHAAGIEPEKIAIVGAPQWDGFYEGHMPGRAESKRILALSDSKRVIAYGATWAQTTSLRSEFGLELRRGYDAFLNLCKEWEADAIVMAHPNFSAEEMQAYAKAMEAAGLRGRVTKDHMLYCLTAADLLVMQGPSNLCIEAAVLGTPSVYIQTEGFDYAHPLPYRCLPADLPAQAQAALDSTGADSWQDFITYYNSAHPNGGAAETCVRAVLDICGVPQLA